MHPGDPPPEPLPSAPVERKAAPPDGDPVAAILGNATGLGLGYALIRRPLPAVAALLGTVLALAFITAFPDSWFWRMVLAVWWLAMIGHAAWITRSPRPQLVDLDDPAPSWRPRVFAAGVIVLIVSTAAWFRHDADAIVHNAETVHAAGDCATARDSLGRLGAAHRVANGAAVIRGAEALDACELLLRAEHQAPSHAAETLQSYLGHAAARWDGAGPLRAELLLGTVTDLERSFESSLEPAFAQLSLTLDSTPGQSERVREVVEDFLADFPETMPPCAVMSIDDWMRTQDWDHPELAEPIAADVERVPQRIIECARDDFANDRLSRSRTTYQGFLADYPDHDLAAEAEAELEAVETAIERANVDRLLRAGEYCDDPAPYGAAPAYKGKGPHAMWAFGIDPSEYEFPSSWQADDIDDTVLVLCVEGPERGSLQATCRYEPGDAMIQPISGYVEVDFYATRFDIRAYELRTGKPVALYAAEIGDPCPSVLEYRSYGLSGPPSEVDSEYSDEDVRDMFRPLMD